MQSSASKPKGDRNANPRIVREPIFHYNSEDEHGPKTSKDKKVQRNSKNLSKKHDHNASQFFLSSMRNSSANFRQYFLDRHLGLSACALSLINQVPTRPQDLYNFLSCVDKLRAAGETSPQVIAKASEKLMDFLGAVELRPAVTGTNREIKVANKDVRKVQWSPNGEKFAAASGDSSVRIFDFVSACCEHTLTHDTPDVRCLQWNRSGDMIATGGGDGFARIFDTCTGEEVVAYEHQDTVKDVQWCPQGLRLATASSDKYAGIFKTDSDVAIRLPHGDEVQLVRWDPSGQRLATSSNEHVSRIFDGFTGEVLSQITHEQQMSCVDWNVDGSRLAISTHDKNVSVWDVSSDECELEHILVHGDVATIVEWCPASTKLATASRDKSLRVFDANGKMLTKWLHDGKLCTLRWSLDGEQIATASTDGVMRVFDVLVNRETARWKHGGSLQDVDWKPHSQMIAACAIDGYVSVYNVTRCAEELKMQHGDVVRHVQWSSDGSQVASASFDTNVRVFGVPSGNLIHKFSLKEKVRDVQWSPDGKKLAASADSDAVIIFNMETGREICQFKHPERVPNVMWHPNAIHLATACFDKNARIYNTETLEEVHRFMHASSVLHADWSSDGRCLATLALRDKYVRVYDVESETEICPLPHDDWVLAMEWNPKRNFIIVTASDDKHVRLFDTQIGEQLSPWIIFDDVVRIVRWSPSGDLLATSPSAPGGQQLVHVIDIDSRVLVFTLKHKDKIQDVQWSSNGEMLATASSDKFARIFDMWSGDEVAKWHHGGVVRDCPWSPCGSWLGTSCGDGCARIFNAEYAIKVSMHFNRTPGLSMARRESVKEKALKESRTFLGKVVKDDVAFLKNKRISRKPSGLTSDNLGTSWESCPFSEVIRLPCGAGYLPLQKAMITMDSAEFDLIDLQGKHLIFDNGGYTLPPHWSMNISTLHLALYAAILYDQDGDVDDTDAGSSGSLGHVLDTLLRCGAKETLFYSDLFGLNVLDLALRLKQPAVALDVLVPEVLEQMKQEPLEAYRSGFDISLGRVLGALTMRGEATALTRITLPQMLDSSIFEASPDKFGVHFDNYAPPKLASKSRDLRTIGSETPWVGETDHKKHMDKLLPWGAGGLNVPTALEVVLLADVLSPRCQFFEGLCTVPQDDEHDLFTHRAIRAFVDYKWNTSAKYRFFALCIDYLVFVLCFFLWSCRTAIPEFATVSSGMLLEATKICCWVALFPVIYVEFKQFLALRSAHFTDEWNQITAACIVLVIVSLSDISEEVNLIVQPFAAVLVWLNALYYLRGFHMTGPYIRTLGTILLDLRGFLIVFVLLQVGFSHAMYLSWGDDAHSSDAENDGLPFSLKVLLKTYMIGVLGEVTERDYYSSAVRYILFFMTTASVTIVLLNTLIAAISETFDRLQEHSEASWVKGRAQLIHEMELVFGKQEAPAYVIYSKVSSNKARLDDNGGDGKIALIKRAINEEVSRAEFRLIDKHKQVEHQLGQGLQDLNEKVQRQEKTLEQIASRLATDDEIVGGTKSRQSTRKSARSSMSMQGMIKQVMYTPCRFSL